MSYKVEIKDFWICSIRKGDSLINYYITDFPLFYLLFIFFYIANDAVYSKIFISLHLFAAYRIEVNASLFTTLLNKLDILRIASLFISLSIFLFNFFHPYAYSLLTDALSTCTILIQLTSVLHTSMVWQLVFRLLIREDPSILSLTCFFL